MYTTLIILLVTAVLFAVGRVRSDIIALCALICLLLTGNLTTNEALSGFSNPVVIMMAGLGVPHPGAHSGGGAPRRAVSGIGAGAGPRQCGHFAAQCGRLWL